MPTHRHCEAAIVPFRPTINRLLTGSHIHQAPSYFHVMTAYAILRSEGVARGKPDYIPHMLRFLRQP